MPRVLSVSAHSEGATARKVLPFLLPTAVSIYVGVLAYAYYFHRWGIARHHLETGWMWLVAVLLIYGLSTRGSSVAPVHAVQRLDPLMVCAFVVAAGVLYFPAVSVGFLSDDYVLARLAAQNEFLGGSWEFFRPLPVLCFKLAGAHPVVLHSAIIMLHGANAALVAALAAAAGQSPAAAVVAGALFLTFPAHAEAVAWCSGLQDVLMTTGVLTAVALANAARERLALPALAGALLSKETAVVAPALLWLVQSTAVAGRSVWTGNRGRVCGVACPCPASRGRLCLGAFVIQAEGTAGAAVRRIDRAAADQRGHSMALARDGARVRTAVALAARGLVVAWTPPRDLDGGSAGPVGARQRRSRLFALRRVTVASRGALSVSACGGVVGLHCLAGDANSLAAERPARGPPPDRIRRRTARQPETVERRRAHARRSTWRRWSVRGNRAARPFGFEMFRTRSMGRTSFAMAFRRPLPLSSSRNRRRLPAG